jgi:DinB superfamily
MRHHLLALTLWTAASGSTALAADAPPTVASTVDRQITNVEKLVTDIAEAMPEEKYGFTPEALKIPGSAYEGVRSFAQQVKHVAASNYALWSSIAGVTIPDDFKGGNGPEAVKTKAEILKFLKDSFAVGHKAAATLTPANMLQPPTPSGKSPRLNGATFGVAHAYDHYGQMVEYLRMSGIVPPASRGNSQ